MQRRTLLRASAALGGLAAGLPAWAQSPANVTLWSGFPVGGGLGDQVARPLIEALVNSLTIALLATIISVVMGALAGALVTLPGLASADTRLVLVGLLVACCVVPVLLVTPPPPHLGDVGRHARRRLVVQHAHRLDLLAVNGHHIIVQPVFYKLLACC